MNATEMLLEQHEAESKQLQQQLVNMITAQKPPEPAPAPAPLVQATPAPEKTPQQLSDEFENEQVKQLRLRHQLEMMELQFEKDKLTKQQEFLSFKEGLDRQKMEQQMKEQEKVYLEKLEKEKAALREKRERCRTNGYKAVIEGTPEADENQTQGIQIYL
jgi:hypothetical protein